MVIKTKPTRASKANGGLVSPEYMENSQRSTSSTRAVNLLPTKKATTVTMATAPKRPILVKKEQQTSSKRAPPPSPETAMGKNRSNKKSIDKGVKFNTVSIYHVLSRNEYTQTEKEATWFTAEEFINIRNSAMALAKSIDCLTTAKHKSDLRGLERIMKQNLKKHTARRKALFDEIAFLRKKGFHSISPQDLATLFQSYTANSQLEARGMARDDEKRARDCYSEDDDFMTLFFDLYGGNALICSKEAAIAAPKASKRQSIAKAVRTKKESGKQGKQQQRVVVTTTVDTTSRGIEQKQRFREGISQRLVAAKSLR
jgi:hypothetical protein